MATKKDGFLTELHDFGINTKSREIYLHSRTDIPDESNDEPGIEYGMATRFIKNLHVLDQPPNKPILIHMHSVGGCWDNGMAIFNAIQFSQSYITMLAYSQASSMSGVIFQSAELRIIMPDCHFLVHHGSGGGETKHPFAVHASAEREMKACARMLDIFAKRAVEGPYFKKRKSTTIQSVRSFLDKKLKEKVDWYLDSEEAVWYGLADAVLGSKNYPNIDTLRQG